MLKLDRLELSGFKSFVDPVTVEFAGGITAIVGPNGCGKSNISDAMTWVLGEQSAKSLRGGTMEDVIFAGAESRKPLGMAEVHLTLETDPSFPRSDDGVVEIGRRVFRSGESQYRLNGKTVRLKETRDLLMDTGLGIRAYSVIEQGKIGMILSGKPQERRKLLEEAAGITRYKARKRVAEVKLEEAKANLLRLDDIVSEVERSLRSLKRQASAARRFKAKQEELRELLEEVLTRRWLGTRDEIERLAARLEQVVAKDAELTAGLGREEADLAAGRETLDELAQDVAARHKQVADLAATIEGRQEFLKGGRERLGELSERAAAGERQAERRHQAATELAAGLGELEERRDEIERERSSAADQVGRDQEASNAARRELAQATARLEESRQELLETAAQVKRLEERLHRGEIELERATVRSHHLEQEEAEHGTELSAAQEKLELATDRVTELEGQIEAKRAEVERLSQELTRLVEREQKAAEAVRSLETELSATRQRRELLDELARAHREQRTDLAEALAEAGVDSPVYLAERTRALEGWERSLDLYLGELADAVVLDEGAEGTAVAAHLHGTTAARLVTPLAALSTGDQEAAPEEPDDPSIVLRLGEALGLSPELSAALSPAYLVETAADAERLAHRYRWAAFLAPEGVWFEAGTVHVEGPRSEPGILEREARLAELAEEIPRLEESLATARGALDDLVTQRAAKAKDKNSREQEAAALAQELAVARARKEDAVARHRRLETQGERLGKERSQLEAEIAATRERHGTVQEEIEEARARHTAAEERFGRTEGEVAQAKDHRESLKATTASREGQLQLLAERLAAQEREIARVRQEIEEGERQAQAWRQEAQRLGERRAKLEADMAAAETQLQTALETKADAEESTLAAQETLDARRAALRALEKQIAGRREAQEAVRTDLSELRVRRASLEQDLAHLAESYRSELGRKLVAPEASDDSDEEGDGAQPREDLATLEERLAQTRAALDRLGPVNVLAVEEYAEQEERQRFLTEQRSDVARSVERLKTTIREINETSSERFTEIFAQVNQAFGEIFEKLFRGGEAEMRLMDDEDVLESGIEIVARPPGKRLQNLMLMSGGEKALTAVALLFALFKTKPSPFCILDEVDAPLDDANCVRFVEMLQEMAGETQFLVITHNKITMQAASTLYGVTMEERGVSKLVAVEMDRVQPQARQTA